jgi:hypothetical protein
MEGLFELVIACIPDFIARLLLLEDLNKAVYIVTIITTTAIVMIP